MFDPIEIAKTQFPDLGIEDVLTLVKSSRLVKRKAGHVLIKQGEISHQAAFVVNGLVRVYCVLDDGGEKTVLFRKEQDFVGSFPSMLHDKPAEEQVEALEDSILCLFDFKTFRKLARKNFNISKAYSSGLEKALEETIVRIQDFSVLSPEERYVKFMKENKDLNQRVALKHLASYIGVAVESLSRIRARISKDKT